MGGRRFVLFKGYLCSEHIAVLYGVKRRVLISDGQAGLLQLQVLACCDQLCGPLFQEQRLKNQSVVAFTYPVGCGSTDVDGAAVLGGLAFCAVQASLGSGEVPWLLSGGLVLELSLHATPAGMPQQISCRATEDFTNCGIKSMSMSCVKSQSMEVS